MRWNTVLDALVAIAGVVIGGFIGGLAGRSLAPVSASGWAELGGIVVGMGIGAAVVPPIVLWLYGRAQRRPGHPFLALAGSCIGLVVSVGAKLVMWMPLAVGVIALCALLGFRRFGR